MSSVKILEIFLLSALSALSWPSKCEERVLIASSEVVSDACFWWPKTSRSFRLTLQGKFKRLIEDGDKMVLKKIHTNHANGRPYLSVADNPFQSWASPVICYGCMCVTVVCPFVSLSTFCYPPVKTWKHGFVYKHNLWPHESSHDALHSLDQRFGQEGPAKFELQKMPVLWL